jgi:hypothetical protein
MAAISSFEIFSRRKCREDDTYSLSGVTHLYAAIGMLSTLYPPESVRSGFSRPYEDVTDITIVAVLAD